MPAVNADRRQRRQNSPGPDAALTWRLYEGILPGEGIADVEMPPMSRHSPDRRPTDFIRSRVFVVNLPGMTRRRERLFICHCRRLASAARSAGLPLAFAWDLLAQCIDGLVPRLGTEHERETFVAIMHRLRVELFQDVAFAS